MLDKPISPLRQRMIDDMTARRFKEKVQKDYVRHVRTFAAFLGRSPDTATSEDLRRYQLHLAKQQISPGSINAAIAALRFFARLPKCLIGVEACASGHYWGRELSKLGHQVRLMPPSYVKAYVKWQKNDAADAEAFAKR